MFDGKAYGEGIVELVKGYVEREIAPLKAENEALIARVKELEARPAPEVVKGDPGESVDPEIVKAMVAEEVGKAVAEIPAPKDGKDAAGIVEAMKDSGELVLTLQDGRLLRTGIRDGEKGNDGSDGFALEDFDIAVVDERTIDLRFTRGETTHSFELTFPVPVYRNVFKQGESYVRGDIVTWGGCAWHCEKDTSEKPETGENWSLMVKKGRDGKDAKNG